MIPVMCPEQKDTDALFTAAVQAALEQSHILKDGDLVVLTAGLPLGVSGTTNLLKVQTVGSTFLRGKGLNDLSVSGTVSVGRTSPEVQAPPRWSPRRAPRKATTCWTPSPGS